MRLNTRFCSVLYIQIWLCTFWVDHGFSCQFLIAPTNSNISTMEAQIRKRIYQRQINDVLIMIVSGTEAAVAEKHSKISKISEKEVDNFYEG